MNLAEKEGWVAGTPMDIWTEQVDAETLNIVHIHVNDTADQVTIDVAFVHENESPADFTEFRTDMSGRPLRYKILVHNGPRNEPAVMTVLYNDMGQAGEREVHEIPFNERRIALNSYVITEA